MLDNNEKDLFEGLKQNFGKNLSAITRFHKVQQKDLAEALNVTPTYVSLICTGDKLPALEVCCQLSDMFGFNIHDMAKDLNERKPIQSSEENLTPTQKIKNQVNININLRKTILNT